MRSYLQLVATGPELSKSLDQDQAKDAISLILGGEVDPIQAAIFLIALRMKRETDAENIGALNGLIKYQQHAIVQCEEILAIADPFNGFVRGLPATPFLPAVLAAAGLPCYIHGVKQAGPKYGITANMVIAAADLSVERSVGEAASCLERDSAGWSYIDQSSYIPALHNLVELRDTMVKRTCISTLEVVLKPLSGIRRTHLLTGFVHKAYPPVYSALARHVGFDSAIIVRGVEGGCIPSLSQVSRYFGYHDSEDLALHKLSPKDAGVDQEVRAVPVPENMEQVMADASFQNTDQLLPVVNHVVDLGLDALTNRPGPMRDSLIYGGAISLRHTGFCSSLAEGVERIVQTLKSGEALARFNAR
jgi:anthranilate phosphoribosyltransferase